MCLFIVWISNKSIYISRLTQLQRRFSPLLHNETILEVAGMVPDGLQLLATLADVLDNPTMVDISSKLSLKRRCFKRSVAMWKKNGILIDLPCLSVRP